jgi:hypothetical protein
VEFLLQSHNLLINLWNATSLQYQIKSYMTWRYHSYCKMINMKCLVCFATPDTWRILSYPQFTSIGKNFNDFNHYIPKISLYRVEVQILGRVLASSKCIWCIFIGCKAALCDLKKLPYFDSIAFCLQSPSFRTFTSWHNSMKM